MEVSPETATREEGIRLLKAGQTDDAIKVFEKILRTDEGDAAAHMCLGVAYNQKNDRMRAIHHLETGLSLKESAKGYYNLGLVYEAAHRIDEAVRQYRMAVELEPEYAPASDALHRLQEQYAAAHPQPEPPAAATQTPPPGTAPNQTVMDPNRIPVAPSGPPDWQQIQADKQRQVEEAARAQLKGGLTYGIICGSIFITLCYLAASFWLFTMPRSFLSIAIVVVGGMIYGALVGLWIGYTCGGDSAGMQAGAAIGALGFLVVGIITGAGIGSIIFMIVGGLFSGVLGWLIGQLVEMSIAQV